MSKEWRKGFREAMFNTVLRRADLCKDVEPWALWFGWQDYGRATEARAHIEEVGINYEQSSMEDVDWQGSYDEDQTVHGVDLHLVLNDGTRYRWRYGGRFGDLLMAMALDDL